MRLRRKKWTNSLIEENKNLMIVPIKGEQISLDKVFNNSKKVCLEIGCGKGNFVINNAIQNPDCNYIGYEKNDTVLAIGLKKAINLETKINNLKFLNSYAENLNDLFLPDSFFKIFLNFSDPWPKARHEKRRLTNLFFLDEVYSKLVVKDGFIEFKTDNDSLYEFTLEQIQKSKYWKIVKYTDDLYKNQEMLSGNIQTEYEKKFHELGQKIKKIILINKK